MKKLLALTALAATVAALTGCGPSTGNPPSGPPALIQPAAEQMPPLSNVGQRTIDLEDNPDGIYEYTGINSDGAKFRCYVTDRYQSVAQTCFEYPKQ